eukprot:jgi/Hompol1/5739/HPOL_004661-RA
MIAKSATTTTTATMATLTATHALATLQARAARPTAKASSASASVRLFSTSHTSLYPRIPSRPPPNVKPRYPTAEQLAIKAPEPPKTPEFPWFPSFYYGPLHRLRNQPKAPKRFISDVERARPLPTTFAPGETEAMYRTRPDRPSTKLDPSEYHGYPYRFYEVTLRRGLFGLPRTQRKIVESFGLTQRHQVVWRHVGPRSAGQILKIKELVHVRLTNEIPAKDPLPKGYVKKGSMIASWA